MEATRILSLISTEFSHMEADEIPHISHPTQAAQNFNSKDNPAPYTLPQKPIQHPSPPLTHKTQTLNSLFPHPFSDSCTKHKHRPGKTFWVTSLSLSSVERVETSSLGAPNNFLNIVLCCSNLDRFLLRLASPNLAPGAQRWLEIDKKRTKEK